MSLNNFLFFYLKDQNEFAQNLQQVSNFAITWHANQRTTVSFCNEMKPIAKSMYILVQIASFIDLRLKP